MDVIEMTRELGKVLQQDDRYIAYNLAKQVNDNDAELQADIENFTNLRIGQIGLRPAPFFCGWFPRLPVSCCR